MFIEYVLRIFDSFCARGILVEISVIKKTLYLFICRYYCFAVDSDRFYPRSSRVVKLIGVRINGNIRVNSYQDGSANVKKETLVAATSLTQLNLYLNCIIDID